MDKENFVLYAGGKKIKSFYTKKAAQNHTKKASTFDDKLCEVFELAGDSPDSGERILVSTKKPNGHWVSV